MKIPILIPLNTAFKSSYQLDYAIFTRV